MYLTRDTGLRDTGQVNVSRLVSRSLASDSLPFLKVELLAVVADTDGPTIRFGISNRVD